MCTVLVLNEPITNKSGTRSPSSKNPKKQTKLFVGDVFGNLQFCRGVSMWSTSLTFIYSFGFLSAKDDSEHFTS